MHKKLLVILSSLGFFVLLPAPALAAGKNITNIRTRVDKRIDKRIDRLNKLISRVKNNGKLTDAQKLTITDDASKEIADLNVLKSKVANDTDPKTLRADVKTEMQIIKTDNQNLKQALRDAKTK